MRFPLCNKITPRTTLSSLHVTDHTLLFIHPPPPLFFCSPITRTISPSSGICCFSWFILWLSIRPLMYSLCQRRHACCLALFSRLYSLVTSSSSIPMSANSCTFCPYMIMFGVNVSGSSSLLLTYVHGLLLRCFSMSMTTASNCSKVRCMVPRVL